MKIELTHPVELAGVIHREIELREVVEWGDMVGVDFINTGQITFEEAMMIAARLSGQPDVMVKRISFQDAQAIFMRIMGFLAPKDGSTKDG